MASMPTQRQARPFVAMSPQAVPATLGGSMRQAGRAAREVSSRAMAAGTTRIWDTQDLRGAFMLMAQLIPAATVGLMVGSASVGVANRAGRRMLPPRHVQHTEAIKRPHVPQPVLAAASWSVADATRVEASGLYGNPIQAGTGGIALHKKTGALRSMVNMYMVMHAVCISI